MVSSSAEHQLLSQTNVVASKIEDLDSKLEEVGTEIKKVDAEIKKVDAKINAVEEQLKSEQDPTENMYLRKEDRLWKDKEMLRKDKEMLRKKEEQLREDKAMLRKMEAELLKSVDPFEGSDVIDLIINMVAKGVELPGLLQLKHFIQETPGDLMLPVPQAIYNRLSHSQLASQVFRIAMPGENWLRSYELALFIVSPPVPDGSEDSFHVLWDILIFFPIRTFLGGYVRNVRNESGESTAGITRSDVTYYLDGYALLKGEEKGDTTAGDPDQELVEKETCPYFRSIPYVLGYWARGHRLVLCALYRECGSKSYMRTCRLDLLDLDLRDLDHRIKLLVACLQFSRILTSLKGICIRDRVRPDTVMVRPSGKRVALIGGSVKKTYPDFGKAVAVSSIYTLIHDCPNVEQVIRKNVEKGWLVFHREVNNAIPTSEMELVYCILCILQALVCIHEKGIMHRDIRWENVARSSTSNNWLLIDFDEATYSPSPVGHLDLDLRSHAPEVHGPHDDKVDIWGVGYLLQNSKVVLHPENVLVHLGDKCLRPHPGHRDSALICFAEVNRYYQKLVARP